MPQKKIDGVIEAVRYQDGHIVYVRAYERRGATFSDRVLIERGELIEQLKRGKKFVIGQRKELWASTFETSKLVQVVKRNNEEIVSTRPEASHDELEGVPVF